MKRGDLLQEKAKIFIPQAKALNDYAHRDVKVLVFVFFRNFALFLFNN